MKNSPLPLAGIFVWFIIPDIIKSICDKSSSPSAFLSLSRHKLGLTFSSNQLCCWLKVHFWKTKLVFEGKGKRGIELITTEVYDLLKNKLPKSEVITISIDENDKFVMQVDKLVVSINIVKSWWKIQGFWHYGGIFGGIVNCIQNKVLA